MKLSEDSIKWAIQHLNKENDGDLFPRPLELDVINEMEEELINSCKEIDIGSYKWHAARRFLIPKDDLSYRLATQLDLLDSIIFSALIYVIGERVEKKRLPENTKTIFSYRFKPNSSGTLYSNKDAWKKFWFTCSERSKRCSHVLVCDISDFYNQIYHHTIENQLISCEIENEIIKSILSLLTSLTAKSSRGIPVGPHAAHLIAELSLIPLDEVLNLRGYKFCRYVDDIIVFCESETVARITLYTIADTLDKQQRMILQKGKTKILSGNDFRKLCKKMHANNPLNELEATILEIINKYSGGNSYTKVKLTKIDAKDLKVLSKENIVGLLNDYLQTTTPDYERIRWLYRRLAQIGIPHAIDFSIQNFDYLIPAINDVCLYISSCAENYDSDWKPYGVRVLALLEHPIIASNDFFKIALLNLFVRNKKLNHFDVLLSKFPILTDVGKRKIILSSLQQNAGSWIRELKETYPRLDDWNKKAYLMAAKLLPKEERAFFYKEVKSNLAREDILEDIIIKWSKKIT